MRTLAVALSLLLSSPAWALTVAGVNVPPTVSVGQRTLDLNGAGVRTKFFVKVYVGSLYTEKKVSTTDELLKEPGEKAVRMHLAYKSDGAKNVDFHKRSMPKPKYRELRERFTSCGIEEISSEDLESL